MSYINVSGAGEFATLNISVASDMSTPLAVPALQEIGISNSNGVFRFKTLNSTSESAVLTPATNQVTLSVIVDQAAMFGDGAGDTTAVDKGLFKLSNDKVRVYFEIDMGGDSGNTVSGTGFLAGLTMSVTPDQPLWSAPLTIEVDGNYTLG
jgi:hypothetical protein